MTKGKEIIEKRNETISEMKPSKSNIRQLGIQAELSHTNLMEIHSRVMACHCECLGMNSENTLSAVKGENLPYSDLDYESVMKKWGLIGDKGEVLI